MSGEGYVYLMLVGSHYKIGCSADPERRRLDLDSPAAPVNLIHRIKTDDKHGLEGALHRRFAGQCVGREYFLLSQEDVAAIRAVAVCDSPLDLPPALRDRHVPEPKRLAASRLIASMHRLCKARGWGRHDLIKASGICLVSLSAWRRGKRYPRPETLNRLADALGVSLDELCGRTDVAPAPRRRV